VQSDHDMPVVLRQLHQLEFDYADGEGIDFEPFPAFLSGEETKNWIHAWTGNALLDGTEYRVFGQDGSGGYAAVWCARPNAPLTDQPIVFFGSEGELGVVAGNLSDYLWLLAGNLGPCEAISNPDFERATNQLFAGFAAAHATTPRKSPADVISCARAEFPQFESDVRAVIAY
jgi:hypothetical protein